VTDNTSIAFMDVKMLIVNNRAHGSHDTVSATRSSFRTALSNKPRNIVLRVCKINSTHGELKHVAAALFERIMIIDDTANAKHDNAMLECLESIATYQIIKDDVDDKSVGCLRSSLVYGTDILNISLCYFSSIVLHLLCVSKIDFFFSKKETPSVPRLQRAKANQDAKGLEVRFCQMVLAVLFKQIVRKNISYNI
jgi:hypothetical protein